LVALFGSIFTNLVGVRAQDVIRIADAAGEGNSDEEALKDAFTNAVQQAVGLYLTSNEKLEKNGDAIREISAFSNGYITWYEKLSLSDTKDGKKRVLIACDVSRSRTAARLEKLGIKISQSETGKVDGKPLFAEEVTKIKQQKEAVRLLSEVLSHVPSTKDMIRGAKLLPRKLKPDEKSGGSGYFCKVFFKLDYDYSSFTQYCKWVDKTMQHAGFTDRYEKSYSHQYVDTRVGNDVFWEDRVQIQSNLDRRNYSTFLDLHQVINSKDEKQGALILLTDFQCDDDMDINDVMKDGKAFDGKAHVKTKWVVYKLERSVLRQIETEVYRKAYNAKVSFEGGYRHYVNLKPLETEIVVLIEGANGKSVASKRIKQQESRNINMQHFFRDPVNLEDRGNALVVSFIDLGPRISLENPNKKCSIDLKLSDLEVMERFNVKLEN